MYVNRIEIFLWRKENVRLKIVKYHNFRNGRGNPKWNYLNVFWRSWDGTGRHVQCMHNELYKYSPGYLTGTRRQIILCYSLNMCRRFICRQTNCRLNTLLRLHCFICGFIILTFIYYLVNFIVCLSMFMQTKRDVLLYWNKNVVGFESLSFNIEEKHCKWNFLKFFFKSFQILLTDNWRSKPIVETSC